MSLGGCNCCEQPQCSAPELEYRSATCETCGFVIPTHPDVTEEDRAEVYGNLEMVYTRTTSLFSESGEGDSYTSSTITVEESGSRKYTMSVVDGECVESFVEGSWSSVTTSVSTYAHPEFGYNYTDVATDTTSADETGVWTGTFVTTSESDPASNGSVASSSAAPTVFPNADFDFAGGIFTLAYTESDFYTSLSIAHQVKYTTPVEPCTPPDYPGWPSEVESSEWTEGQGAESAALKSDGPPPMKTQIEYRLRHLPSGTCYVKVWIATVTALDGEAPSAPVITTYEWAGTGNPCLPVPLAAADDDAQKISADAVEILPPATAGSISVSVLKFSCVQGYEPDTSDEENPQPNGYPDPTWEPAAP